MKKGYSIFHLNISFSSLAEDQRKIVIENCYVPLIEMISNSKLKISLEITGFTVEQIKKHKPDLISKINECIKSNNLELIFSGYEQIIYQLTPYEIIKLNVDLGKQVFNEAFGFVPKIFWANEQCFSSDMIKNLSNLGFTSLIIEKENLQKKLNIKTNEPCIIRDDEGHSINVVWNSSYYFQLFQRIIHGEYTLEKADEIYSNLCSEDLPLCIYGSDAEVFNYRPKRFHEESELSKTNEWEKIFQLYTIIEKKGIQTCFIKQILDSRQNKKIISSSEIDYLDNPVYVKKQKKYNLSRWALTGRDDLNINSRINKLVKDINLNVNIDSDFLKNIVSLFSSDLRTHIDEKRWNTFIKNLVKLENKYLKNKVNDIQENLIYEKLNKNYFEFKNRNYLLEVEPNKGLAIQKFAFKNNPIQIGKLAFGYFKDIDYLADYYSGNYLIETNEIPRYSDLSAHSSEISDSDEWLHLRSQTQFNNAKIIKKYSLLKNSNMFLLNYDFSNLVRQFGFVRVCYLTFINYDQFQDFYISYPVDKKNSTKLINPKSDFNHGMAISKKISSRTLIPAKCGVLNIHAESNIMEISWDNCKTATFPMAELTRIGEKSLFRIYFSLGESDETFREGGMYGNLELKITSKK